MRQVWYRGAAEYDADVGAMLAAGWTMAHWQVNDDGTLSATWRPPVTAAPAAPRTTVGIYEGEARFRRGMAAMVRRGWQVRDVAMAQDGRPLIGIVTLGLFARQRIRYTVVYER